MIKSITRVPLALVMAIFLLSGGAYAKGGSSMDVQGKILEHKDVNLKGTNVQNKVLLLQTQQGTQIVADLGPKTKLQGINLEKGMNIQARGEVHRVGDRPVLFVSQLRMNGKSVDIARQKPMKPKTAAKMEKKQGMQQITGKVMQTKEVPIRGRNINNFVVLLETRDGQQMPVDLGPTKNLKTEIKEGQSLTITGRPMLSGNRMVFVASEVSSS